MRQITREKTCPTPNRAHHGRPRRQRRENQRAKRFIIPLTDCSSVPPHERARRSQLGASDRRRRLVELIAVVYSPRFLVAKPQGLNLSNNSQVEVHSLSEMAVLLLKAPLNDNRAH